MEKVDFTPLKDLLKLISDTQLRADIAKAVARIEVEVNKLNAGPLRVVPRKMPNIS